jgi:hypothetical protein
MRASEPNALTSTGMSKPSTCSNSTATLPSPGVLETRSTISVISRSRETDAVTRRRHPSFSRRARKSRRSVNAIDLLLVEDADEPAGEHGKARLGTTRTSTKRHPMSGASQAMIRWTPKSDHDVM